jgi:hypothetical protein
MHGNPPVTAACGRYELRFAELDKHYWLTRDISMMTSNLQMVTQ